MARRVREGRRRRPRRGLFLPVVLLTAVLTVALAVAVSLAGGPRALLARTPVGGEECPSSEVQTTKIAVVVAPDIAPTVQRIIAPLREKALSDGRCLDIAVTAQAPAETVAGAQLLPAERAPQLWIPDSSLWLGRLERWKPTPIASFASSPVVVASSSATLQRLGWLAKPPSWDAAMTGAHAVAAPNIAQDAAELSATIAMWQALGKGEPAERGLAAAVLAGERAGAPSRGDALAAARAGKADAPVIPVSEQVVLSGWSVSSNLTAVYPEAGSPSLDYPVARLDVSAGDDHAGAIEAITRALRSAASQAMLRADGFRDSTGKTLADIGAPAKVVPLLIPGPNEVAAVVARVVALSAPSRVLVVIDVSGSMRGPAGNGMDRVTFAGEAAIAAGNFMPDVAQVGLWAFSRNLTAGQDRVQIYDVAELGSREGALYRRQAVERALRTMSQRLGGDGTTLYSTAIAAMQKMNSLYDPRAGNAVVLFTDGKDEDEGGPSLEQTITALKRLYDPKKPVRLIGVGIGGEADLAALKQLAAATGGGAYAASDPRQLPQILFDVMNRRPGS
jgi:Ca-activated chloride channel family protein